MPQVAAIYGFEFTRTFQAAGLTFTPTSDDHSGAKRLARALDAYNVTGTVSALHLPRELLYRLEAVLSFIEHLDVRVSDTVNEEEAIAKPHEFFESTVVGGARNNGGGAVVGSDAFNPWRTSRQQFVELALSRLADEDFCRRTKFNSLFFKAVETFRQRKPFLEISYFLLMSGLEAFARASLNDYASKASAPITQVLSSYGFRVYEDNPGELARAITTYLHLRNALFHQGEFSKAIQINNDQVTLDCSAYLYNLSMLVSLTCMKVIAFDDGHTNWDCWIDRQLHR